MFKNALISVSDKQGLASFVLPLAQSGMRVLSTGGTAKYLAESGIKITQVSEQTAFPEVMDGRVKTLHPNIHMCLLARDHVSSDLELLNEKGLEPFDLVIGNLYAFEEALSKGLDELQQTEFIDIGGPSFLRAAAKNFHRITVLCDPADYEWVAEKKELTLEDRKYLAAKVFDHVSAYDSMIANSLMETSNYKKSDFSLGGKFVQSLRYGENPGQKAAWYRTRGMNHGLHNAKILQGKPLSYNNILDLEAAVTTLREFDKGFACVAVKHNNPCGVATGTDQATVVKQAVGADPVSVFGGILSMNDCLTVEIAESISGLFLECIIAPKYEKKALEVLEKKKNLRLLEWNDLMTRTVQTQLRSVDGGFLIQSNDKVQNEWSDDFQVFGEEPNDEVKQNLMLAWKVCAHLKSNAIAIAAENQTVGLGMGQVNRVDAVEQSIQRMQAHHKGCKDPVLASDAFFPFADSIERAASAGIKWVIQPGGSIRDEEVKEKSKELNVNLILTGQRHFFH